MQFYRVQYIADVFRDLVKFVKEYIPGDRPMTTEDGQTIITNGGHISCWCVAFGYR